MTSLPRLGAELLAELGYSLPVVGGNTNHTELPLAEIEAKDLVESLIYFDPERRRHTTLYNGGVCGYSEIRLKSYYRWHDNEPLPSDEFRVLIYALAVRDAQAVDQENRRFEVRPIVGQRRHPWHPADGGTFQQLCPEDYILLRVVIWKEANVPWSSDYVFKYVEKNQVDTVCHVTEGWDQFFSSVDPDSKDHDDTGYFSEVMTKAIELPHNPFFAPTKVRRDVQETDRLIERLKQLLERIFPKDQPIEVQEIDYAATYNRDDFLGDIWPKFRDAAKNTAHKFWAGAVTNAHANARVFKVHHPKVTTGPQFELIEVQIGTKRLIIGRGCLHTEQLSATYTQVEKHRG